MGYCAAGLGRVSDNFMRAAKTSKLAKVTGLVSGRREKAEKIAADFDVLRASGFNRTPRPVTFKGVSYNSGGAMATWAHFSGPAVSGGMVFAVDHESNVYCFGSPPK